MDKVYEWQKDGLSITTDRSKADIDTVHQMLQKSYWAESRSRDTIARSIENSLCFVLLDGDKQIGFARVITDYAVTALLCDVYIDENHRKGGLGKWLVETVLAHPELQGLKRWTLNTKDAHGLYARYGFKSIKNPTTAMEKVDLQTT